MITVKNENGATNGEERTDGYHKLIELGINKKVAEEFDTVYKAELLNHEELDDRALEAIKEYPAEGAVAVLKKFQESNIEHVTNKSAYLCSLMKAYRNKYLKIPTTEKKGPDEDKLNEILEKSGYSLDVTTGQRKYGGPPPGCEGLSTPGAGHEVFCGKIPKDVFEDELIPLFESCGKLWDLRLMMEPLTGQNRGYCFVTFYEREGASKAVEQLNNFEIKKGKTLKVNISIANTRIFVGNIPKEKSKEEIFEEFKKLAEGLAEVIIYDIPDNAMKKNRGFAFLEYDSHKNASAAKRRLGNGRKVWKCDIIVDWADPQEEPDEETMSKVKVLYVRNLTTDVTEEQLKEKFIKFGAIERVKKQKNYAFVHFEEKESADAALKELHDQFLDETDTSKPRMDISLAKPQSEASKKSKDARKREQERQRMVMMMMQSRTGPDWGPRGGGPPGGMRGGGMRRAPPPMNRGGYNDYDYGYGGYGFDDYGYDYRGGYDDPYGYGYEYYDEFNFGGQYGPPQRGRGRGGPPAKIPRGRGGVRGRGMNAPIPRGRGGMPVRGPPRGRGSPRGAGMGAKQRGGKRKMGGDHTQGGGKRRNVQENWGAQPIAQQPLGQSSYNNYGNNDAQWYQDSYGQNWS